MELAKTFGELVVELGFATREQVLRALKEQYVLWCTRGRRLFLGEVLVQMGFLGMEQLVVAANLSRGPSERPAEEVSKVFFGDVAVAKGYVTPLQLLGCLERQRAEDLSGLGHRLIGEIMLEAGHLTVPELEDVVATLVELGYSIPRSDAARA